jgi:hypothetical protein
MPHQRPPPSPINPPGAPRIRLPQNPKAEPQPATSLLNRFSTHPFPNLPLPNPACDGKQPAAQIVQLSPERNPCQEYFNRLTIRFGSVKFADNRALGRAKTIEMNSFPAISVLD